MSHTADVLKAVDALLVEAVARFDNVPDLDEKLGWNATFFHTLSRDGDLAELERRKKVLADFRAYADMLDKPVTREDEVVKCEYCNSYRSASVPDAPYMHEPNCPASPPRSAGG